MAEDVVLAARNVAKRFGSVTAVADLSFTALRNEIVCLLGPSGCGKTTTLRMVAGFERPDAGEIELNGRVVASGNGIYVPPERRDLGMVFQSYAIWPHMTVFQNVALPLQVRRVGRSEIRRRVAETLELVDLPGLEERPATALSGGQQQRVALARALVYSPEILLLDEPLSNLDATLRTQMRGELKQLQERLGITMLFVTHDQIEAMSLASRMAVVHDGRIEQMGTPREIYDSPSTQFVANFVGHILRFTGTVQDLRDDSAIVQLSGVDGGSIRIQRPLGGTEWANGPIVVAIRPEHVRLEVSTLAERPNSVRGVVRTKMFLGSGSEVLVEVGGRRYALAVPNALAEGLMPGAAIDLDLPEDRIHSWPAVPAPLRNGQSEDPPAPRSEFPGAPS